ncbi:phosphoadenosine phosphosulfate reductase family protein [Caballeronia sp. SEWSISQ10-4 2]|uniref:phosphoadenosine phosphosulfate reductase family protein n=1 Tax=Caballeronia sp. SEWSISQ10-4 2 TaxID=2937438 RepID=UPI00264A93EA|nr:phosphoadenosine phosphosulfate reductase family protein [Caballeronia sp. SEWSISQ10-4 2]MDN7179114.1 phosphoadenosine phosphosulfate reductase family protein [Caballeronia sp. SEWSISQ10-4 2]
MNNIIDNHEKIGLQFSGGKDSLAMLHLMREHWDKLTVYWLDTGDAFPETVALVDEIEKLVPRLVRIAGRQRETIEQYGIPSDIVPAANTPIGLAAKGGTVLIQDRYSCCMRSLMWPLHEQMIGDGITLIVRGQKNSDKLRAPIKSGYVEDGIEYLFPLEDWDDSDVRAFLKDEGVELPRFYERMSASPDCMTCSAYWEDGRGAYLKEHHPEAYAEYQSRLNAISAANAQAITFFNMEIGG